MLPSKDIIACLACGFKIYLPIYGKGHFLMGLYSHARFPGRMLVLFDRHKEDFATLSEEVTTHFMKAVQEVSFSLKKLPDVVRINVTLLGDAEHHVHAHVIPRLLLTDLLGLIC